MKRIFWLLILLLGMGACSEKSNDTVFKVATDATLVPMAYINDQNQIEGFEPDLLAAIAREAGFRYELTNVEWAGVIGGVATGKYDMAISSITILEERKKNVDFSLPYLTSGLAIVVAKERQEINSMKDLKNGAMKVGAQRGTTAFFFLENHHEIQRVGYEQYGHAVADLIKGQLDAVVGESTGTLYYKNHDNAIFDQIKMVGEIMTQEHYGIIVSKNQPQLLAGIDQALAKLIANGTVKELHDKWDLGTAASVPLLSQSK